MSSTWATGPCPAMRFRCVWSSGPGSTTTQPGEPGARNSQVLVPSRVMIDGFSASSTEADQAGWQTPAGAIEDWKAGRCGLLPPTWMTLADLAELDTVADAMAATRVIDKIMPKVLRDGDVLRIVLPGDTRFDEAAGHLDARPGDRLERP